MEPTRRRQRINEAAKLSRRSHKKSRQGCRNCKLRSIKCDETKPNCEKCVTYGVSCTYNSKAADFQSSFDNAASFNSQRPRDQPLSNCFRIEMIKETPRLFLAPAIISDGYSSLEMDAQDFERLRRFHLRTVLTFGSPTAALNFQRYAVEIACSAPYVMHLVQALTSVHDRYLSAHPSKGQIAREAYHMSRAAALFNQKLSEPLHPADRDAVWAATILVGWIAFPSIETTSARDSWPLAPPKPSDLQWLRMNDGKGALWHITNPIRPDSIFSFLADDFAAGMRSVVASDINTHPAFTQLFDLDDPVADSGPYAVAVRLIVSLLHIECDRSTFVRFLFFHSHMQPAFKALLVQKDARALLLLAYWYAKICHTVWWVERRASLECRAICMYLEQYHGNDIEIQELLEYPRMQCGMSVEGGS